MLKSRILTGVFGLLIGLGIAGTICYKAILPGGKSEVNTGEAFRPDEKAASFGQIALLDPQMAPDEIKPLVMHGFRCMLETKAHCPEYAGDIISCNNCHFCGGATMGGRNGGISLVGVSKVYPRKLPNGNSITLEGRINGCFLRSLNGRPLPPGSHEMAAMIAYLDWISSGVTSVPEENWLGLKELRSHHVPNIENGGKVFAVECAKCHGGNGEGQARLYDLSYPPLWGNESFNNAAGINKLDKMASFVYHNMPYQDPHLTIEQALDVAAYVTHQPRPIFKELHAPPAKEAQTPK